MDALFNDLVSNREQILKIFALRGRKLFSNYFELTCPFTNRLDSKLITNIREASDDIMLPSSVCFPNQYSPEYIIESGRVSNSILVNAIVSHDPDISLNFPSLQGMDCDLEPIWDIHPTGMSTIYKYIDKIPPSLLVDHSNGYYYRTVTPTFIVLFLEQVTSLLSQLSSNYDFVHGYLTHDCIAFRDDMMITLGTLDYASLSYAYVDGSVIRIKPKPDTLFTSQIAGSFIPTLVDPEQPNIFKVVPTRFWETQFRRLEVPYYRSFDFYTLMVSLLALDYWREVVMSDFILQGLIYNTMFDIREVSNIMLDVEALRNPTYNDIVNLLRKYTLKCDALDEMLKGLKRIKEIFISRIND